MRYLSWCAHCPFHSRSVAWKKACSWEVRALRFMDALAGAIGIFDGLSKRRQVALVRCGKVAAWWQFRAEFRS